MRLLILSAVFFITFSTVYSQTEKESMDNIKSRFGAGLGIVAADLGNKAPIRNEFSFLLRFTLKPITKYLFIEFAANIFPENVKYEDRYKDVRAKTFSFSPLFGNSDKSGKIFFYIGPSIDFSLNELLNAQTGFGVTSRLDYSFTKIVAAGINLKYMALSGSQSSSYFIGNLNVSFTL
jgi:hypothetical protein